MPLPMLTQTQLVDAVVAKSGRTKADVKAVLGALDQVVLDSIKSAQRVKIGTVVQVEPKLKAATKKRAGRNPATGEQITIPAKPASVQVKARVLRGAQGSAPSTQKLKKALG